jgi:hypothetical protein
VVPLVTVVASRLGLAEPIGEILASTALAPADIERATGRDVVNRRGCLIWLVDEDELGVIVKRFGRRPPGPEQIYVVCGGQPTTHTWWAANQLAVDLVTVLPVGAAIIRDAVADALSCRQHFCKRSLDAGHTLL